MNWDLSHSHTAADVRWPDPQLDSTEVRPEGQVRIRFPGGHVFFAESGIRRIPLSRDGQVLRDLEVVTEPQTTEAAYEIARRWAHSWALPQRPLDEWFRRRKAGLDGPSSTAQAIDNTRRVGPRGPIPSLEIRYSFTDGKPSLVALEFFWPPDSSS